MRRLIIAALLAALSLAIGIAGVAPAAGGGAGSSTERAAKGKGKSCKAKGKGKRSGKGKRPLASSAGRNDCRKGCSQKKGNKKRGCKAKGKGKGKRAGGAWPLSGYYEGRGGIALSVGAAGRKAELVYSPTNAKTCIEYASIGLPATSATSGLTAFSAGGDGALANGQYSWSIEVRRDFSYRATISSSSVSPFYGQCDRPGAVFTGKLKKVR